MGKQVENSSAYQDRLDYEKKLKKIRENLATLRYIDLQRTCIIRGIDFDHLVNCDIGGLHTWVINHWEDPIIQDRLHQFDQWRMDKMKEIGKEGEPFIRLGFIGEENEETGDIEINKPKRISKPVNPKRERDNETGIFKGTKKALTFQCIKEGKTVEETIQIVMAQFPDAKDKSIKIWVKKAAKTLNS